MTEKLKGTASVLHETKTYEELVEKHSVEVANGLLANAINTALPNAGITSNDVAGIRRQLPRPHRDNYSGLFVI